MYFLRRRHGRKPPPGVQRQPQAAEVLPTHDTRDEQRRDGGRAPLEFHTDPEPIAQVQPKVITKARRPRVAAPENGDCKPAGTFRAGTLHLDRASHSQARQGKL